MPLQKKISKKYKKIRQKRDKTKGLTKKAIGNLKIKHLQTDDMETVNYNSDIEPDNLSNVNFNSNVEIDEVSDAETMDYNTRTNKNSVAQQQAKRIIKKYRNLKRKAAIQNNIPPTKIKILNNNDMMTLLFQNKYPYIQGIG